MNNFTKCAVRYTRTGILLPVFLALAMSTHAQNTASASTKSSFKATISPLLPEQAAGWTRTSAQFRNEPPGVKARYEKEGIPYSINLVLVYSKKLQQKARSKFLSRTGNAEIIKRSGLTFYITEVEGKPGLLTLQGEMTLLLGLKEPEDESLDRDVVREQLLEVFSTFDVERLAALQPHTVLEAMKTLLPHSLLGMTHREMRIDSEDGHSILFTVYQDEEKTTGMSVVIGYGKAIQRKARSDLIGGKAEVETLERSGLTIHFLEIDGRPGLVVFPGKMVLLLGLKGPEKTNPTTAREQLLNAFSALNPQRLKAFQPSETAPAPDPAPEVPVGFEAYTANWTTISVNLVYPREWTVTDFHAATGFLPIISLMKSAEAADELYGDGISISPEDNVRLVTSDNVMVTIGLTGADASSSAPLKMLEAMMGSGIDNAEITQAPHIVSLSGNGTAAMREVRGTSAEGRAIIGQVWIFERGGQLMSATVYLRAGQADALAPTVRTILESVAIEMK